MHQRQRRSGSDEDAEHSERDSLAEHEAQDLTAARAECGANPELARWLVEKLITPYTPAAASELGSAG